MTADLASRYDRLAVVSSSSDPRGTWSLLVAHHAPGAAIGASTDIGHHLVRSEWSAIGSREAVRAVSSSTDAERQELLACPGRYVGFRSEGDWEVRASNRSLDVRGVEGGVVPIAGDARLKVEVWAELATVDGAGAAERELRSGIERVREHILLGSFVRAATVSRSGRELRLEAPLTPGQIAMVVGFVQGMLQGGQGGTQPSPTARPTDGSPPSPAE
jgi:hypothetical protein